MYLFWSIWASGCNKTSGIQSVKYWNHQRFWNIFARKILTRWKEKRRKKEAEMQIYTNALYEQIQSDYDQNSRRWWTSDQIDCIEIGTGKLL